jgi:hypothetical protein
MTFMLMRRLRISSRDLMQSIRGPWLLTVIAVAAAVSGASALQVLHAAPAPGAVLALSAGCAATLIALTLALAPRVVLGPQMLALVDLLLKSRPAVASLPGLRRIARLAHAHAG